MITLTEKNLSEMVNAIVRETSPERIVLFGSRGRRETAVSSDLDLLIVRRGPFGPDHGRRKEISRVRRALSPFRRPKDILVYSVDEIEKWKDSPNHIVCRALKEGRVLYERS